MKRLLVASVLLLAAAGCAQPSVAEAPAPVKPSLSPAKTDRYPASRAWLHSGPEQQVEAYTAMVGEVNANETCMRDVAHSYRGLFLDKDKHEDTPSKQHPGQHHEYGEFAKGVCDDPTIPPAQWERMTPELADALAKGGVKGDDTRRWELCFVRNGDTAFVVCPDGHVVIS